MAPLHSSTVAASWVKNGGLREGRTYTFSRSSTAFSATSISSSRPPASSTGSASPPATEKTRLASRVKDSTSAQRLTPFPPTAQSCRSASWECCSGTINS